MSGRRTVGVIVRRGGVGLWGVFAACLMAALSVAEPQVSVVEVGIGGMARRGRWAAVQVQVRGGDTGVEGRIEAFPIDFRNRNDWDRVPGGVYRRAVSVAPGAAKVFHVCFRYDRFVNAMGVGLYGKGRYRSEIPVTLNIARDEGPFVCGLAPQDRGLLNALVNPGYYPSDPPQVSSFQAAATTLPDQWLGFHAADAILMHQTSLDSMSTPVRQALRDWVKAGGHLVVCFNGNAGMYQSAVYRDWLPVAVEGTRTLTGFPSLDKLDRVTGSEPLAAQPGVAAAATPLAGAQVVREERAEGGPAPIVVTRREGYGRITFVTVDLGNRPFRGWTGLGALARTVFDVRPSKPMAIEDNHDLMNRLGSVPGSRMPSFGLIGLFLAAYIVLISPVNYLVLRRIRRKEWALFTIPALVIVFSLGAYVVAHGIRGGEVWMTRMAFLSLANDQPAGPAATVVHLLSPANRAYSVSSRHAGAWSPLATWQQRSENIYVDQGPPARVAEVSIPMWDRRFLRFDSLYEGGAMSCDLNRRVDALEGRVTNHSNLFLSRLWIVTGDHRSANVGGHLGPGQSMQIACRLSPVASLDAVWGDVLEVSKGGRSQGFFSLPDQSAMSRLGGLGDEPSTSPHAILVARFDAIPWDATALPAASRQRDEGIVTVEFSPRQVGVTPQRRIVQGELTASSNLNRGERALHLYGPSSSAEFRFVLRGSRPDRVEDMVVFLRPDAAQYVSPTAGGLAASGFRHAEGRWAAWKIQEWTAQPEGDVASFISPDTQQVRLTVSGTGACSPNPRIEYRLKD